MTASAIRALVPNNGGVTVSNGGNCFPAAINSGTFPTPAQIQAWLAAHQPAPPKIHLNRNVK
jgi:hypothetical protein